jgi:hypothetical protein
MERERTGGFVWPSDVIIGSSDISRHSRATGACACVRQIRLEGDQYNAELPESAFLEIFLKRLILKRPTSTMIEGWILVNHQARRA